MSALSFSLRPAVEGDAQALLEIYRPFVEETAASFEEIAPTVEEFAGWIAKVTSRWRWLVAERDGRCISYAYASAQRGSIADCGTCRRKRDADVIWPRELLRAARDA